MKNLDLIAEELFNKVRGRFPSITIGDQEGKVTNQPTQARFYDFDYAEGETKLGKVSISLTDEAVEVMYSSDFVANEDIITKENWYGFLKELRAFSKKRMLGFDTRNINKSNLDQRDYQFLATNRSRDEKMNESKMYGTSTSSYQKIGEARIAIKHSKPINTESATGRIRSIKAIYIESGDGERFKYPLKHLNGARAMARHVAEGGNPYDDFGKHITGLSEELSSLKKFKSYVNRSSVMAEGLSGYIDPVNERLANIKKTISSLQNESTYKSAFEGYQIPIVEDVPEDVAENWIDQLTIKQFNEELKDVFPFVYRLVSEATKAKTITAESLLAEQQETYTVQSGDTLYSIAKQMVKYEMKGMDINDAVAEIADMNGIEDPAMIQPGMELQIPFVIGAVGGDPITGEPITRGLGPSAYESQLEDSFEEMMGQFAEGKDCDECGCSPCECDTTEGNEYGHKVRMAKMNGKKKGDEIDGPDGEKIKLEKDEKIPVTEFVLSLFDRDQGTFPKGETAVLTAIEKDYGEQFIEPAKQFIERVQSTYEQYTQPVLEPMIDEEPGTVMETTVEQDDEIGEGSGLQYHTGVTKHGKEYMDKAAQAGREGASQEELGRLKDKYSKAEKNKTTKEAQDIMRLAGL